MFLLKWTVIFYLGGGEIKSELNPFFGKCEVQLQKHDLQANVYDTRLVWHTISVSRSRELQIRIKIPCKKNRHGKQKQLQIHQTGESIESRIETQHAHTHNVNAGGWHGSQNKIVPCSTSHFPGLSPVNVSQYPHDSWFSSFGRTSDNDVGAVGQGRVFLRNVGQFGEGG